MDIKIIGGQKLSGEILPSGSKNSALAILTASILIREQATLKNIPNLSDVKTVIEVLEKLGSVISWDKEKHIIQMDNSRLEFRAFSKTDLGNMKGTSMLWGSMLARFGKSDFEELPGGCTLGARPVDTHFNAFRDLGVDIKESDSGIAMSSNSAGPGTVWMAELSPTATSNIIVLSTVLSGTTKVIGAASELSVQDLCNFLNSAGAKISGVGTNTLTIEGGYELHSTEYEILSDHHEIATFLALAACTNGDIRVHKAMPEHFTPIVREFAKFNVHIKYDAETAYIEKGQQVSMGSNPGHTLLLRPQPWPALPVDMLPLFIPLALESPSGSALFHNWMYESGLFWTTELLKFGANITVLDPHRVMAVAGNKLKGATVTAPYIIRAAVSLIMVALIADGESIVTNTDSLNRGHENFINNLKRVGAIVEQTP